MTREERATVAVSLREQGLKLYEIAECMGLSSKTEAWKLVNYEKSKAATRAYKARNREALREYDKRYTDENRYVCSCGHVYGLGSGTKEGVRRSNHDPRCCRNCAHERSEQIVVAWNIGWSLSEICEWLGWTKGHIGAEMDRLRAKGYDLPYRYNGERNGKKFASQVAA